jgi:glycosyltransferase involved in cell wall biosynthesis
MPIKVVSIVSRMNLGGVAVLLSDLHESLTAPEFSHTLITGVCASNEIDILDGHAEDLNIIQIKTMGRAPSLLGDILTFLSIRRAIKHLSPDIVHTHTSKAGVLGRIAAISLRKNISIVHTYHGHHLYGYFSKFIVNIIVLIERLISLKTDLLVADSTQVMDDLKKVKVGSKNIWRVIPPGIRSFKIMSQGDARREINIEESAFVICWIGRFAEIKNPVLALTSYNKLPIKIRNSSKMIMVGEGTLMPECKEYSEKNNLNVVFPGWMSNIGPYLAASDVLLITSTNEGFGMVIAEAGFFAVPSLSTDVGGVREFIKDGVNGILAQANPIDIASHIAALSSDIKKVTKLGEMARKTTLEKFTVNTFVGEHKKIYRELVE